MAELKQKTENFREKTARTRTSGETGASGEIYLESNWRVFDLKLEEEKLRQQHSLR